MAPDVKNYYYACGGYINKGKEICELNSISQETLENKVIEKILEYYSRYLGVDGRELLAKVVKDQISVENIDFKSAKERVNEEFERIEGIINNLLDNLTAENRELIDKRLNQLKSQKQKLESRLEELERLESSQDQIQDIVSEAMRFISSLEYILKNGLPQEKLVTIRQCIQRIWIDKEKEKLEITIYAIPANNLQKTDAIVSFYE